MGLAFGSYAYVLVSLYHVELVEGGEEWRVYGWRYAYDSDELGTPSSKEEALELAHRYGVPVMIGQGARVQMIVEKLEA
jgi:hypothetical protein